MIPFRILHAVLSFVPETTSSIAYQVQDIEEIACGYLHPLEIGAGTREK
jgi:hypothetical protein